MSSAEPAPTNAPQIVIQQKESLFGRYGKFLIAALVFAVVVIIGLQSSYQSYFNPPTGPQEKFLTGNKSATQKIAVINISGPIVESDRFIEQQVDRVSQDEDIVAVVLRINSPGGTVTYSDYLHHQLRRLATGERREGKLEGEPLPMVVSMGSVCASGGYYLATAVGDTPDALFAEPSTITGSIGVMIPHYDLSGLLESWNVEDDSITSHPLKDMGSLTKPMTDEEREIFQSLVDEMLVDFKEKVKGGRPMFRDNPEDLDAVATGRVYSAKQALELQLIDQIGFIEDALARAGELADVDHQSVRCVEYKPAPAPLDALLGAARTQQPGLTLDLDSLLELSTPRAYFMCTLAPSLVESGGR